MLDTDYAYGIAQMIECSDLCKILYRNIIQKHFNCIYLQNCLVKICCHSPEQICHPHQNCISGTWFAEDLCDLAVFVQRADTGPMMNNEYDVCCKVRVWLCLLTMYWKPGWCIREKTCIY